MESIAVIGASLAGLSAAEALRDHGFDGRLTVVDASPELPADRPPLSKQVLAGTMEPAMVTQRAERRVAKVGLDLRLGVRAERLRLSDRTIDLSDSTALTADGFVLATGASPNSIATPLAGVHTLRTLEDCLAIRADLLASPRRCVVVGAGFIGAEVAATARTLGVDVTVVEFAPLPMQRVMPGEIGGFVAELLSDEGVDLRLGVGVERFEGRTRVERVVFTDGTAIDADVVVVGVGVSPNTAWLDGSGLTLADGVVCDETCQAAPGVVAAGDIARWTNPLYGESMRVEQWENALEQGAYAGRRLLMGDHDATALAELGPHAPVPWFWSDLFDRKLQLAGRVRPGDEVQVVDGSIAERRFVALFRRDDRCVAVLGVNRPRLVMTLRMAMMEPLAWTDALGMFES